VHRVFQGTRANAAGLRVALSEDMTFTNILCATDFSPSSEQAVRVAARIAKERGSALVIAHVLHIPSLAFGGELTYAPPVVRDLMAQAQRRLDDVVRQASEAGVEHVTPKLLNGSPWAEIVTLLRESGSDLCVMGTHGRTGVARMLLGSVAEKVVRHAPCSVLVVGREGEAKPFAHALVPTDFSESAELAIDLAAQIVRPEGRVSLLHVVELPVSYTGEVAGMALDSDLDDRAAAALERSAARIGGKVRVTATTQTGYPVPQTLEALTRDASIDLVVMGSHGRTGITRALVGSVAETVVRHARCPVLVVRDLR
jgi:nucleotide-binding universal stress UspA family protein